jgi:hypothetical protein
MRLLFTIPHYARPETPAEETPRYGSLACDPSPRVQALTACLTALHSLYNGARWFINHAKCEARNAGPDAPWKIDVVICTTRGCHLLDRLPVEPRHYIHHATDAEPLLLGFACQAVLRECLGQYDYYGYLEDDLILRDPWHFIKLAWFNRQVGDDKLLQANRFEAGLNYPVPKVYVDGDLDEQVTAMFQNVHDSPGIVADILGVRVRFERTLNPHSGCYFLNASQMEHWARQRHFLDHDSRFIGPLETTATLGIMRTFKVYRPAGDNADFLEVQHFATGYLAQLCPEKVGSDGK